MVERFSEGAERVEEMNTGAPTISGPGDHALPAKDAVVIAALGDMMMMSNLLNDFRTIPNFQRFWYNVEPLWKDADFVVTNFEGTSSTLRTKVAPKSSQANRIFENARNIEQGSLKDDFSTYLASVKAGGFNYPPALAFDAVRSGIRFASVANNHMFDRGVDGIRDTLDTLHAAGMVTFGARRRAGTSENDIEDWISYTQEHGWEIAWLGCGFVCAECRKSTFMPQKEVDKMVMTCQVVPSVIRSLREAHPDLDAIIVNAHWGAEHKDNVLSRVEKLAQNIVDAGASVILGNHPHVVQKSEYLVAKDGRRAFVIYSSGGFIGGWGKVAQTASAISYVKLRKSSQKLAQVEWTGYVPTCDRLIPWSTLPESMKIPSGHYESFDEGDFKLRAQKRISPAKMTRTISIAAEHGACREHMKRIVSLFGIDGLLNASDILVNDENNVLFIDNK